MSYRTKVRNKCQLPFFAMFHPSDGFDDLRYNHKNSLGMSLLIFLAFVLLSVIEQQFTGLQIKLYDPDEVNIVQTFFSRAALLVLFTVSNWAFCVLVDGKAKLLDIWVVTNYSLLPYIFAGYIKVVLSNILTKDESVFLNFLMILGMLWSLVMIIIAFMIFHEFEMSKTILSLIITAIGMLLIVFLTFLLYSLYQQVSETLLTVFNEIMFRAKLSS